MSTTTAAGSVPATASCQNTSRKRRILLGITGSVAAIKGPQLCNQLLACNYDVKVLLTQGGTHFWNKAADYDPQAWAQMQENLLQQQQQNQLTSNDDTAAGGHDHAFMIYYPDDEWRDWNRMGDLVLHIWLRDWADMFLVAPLSAHSLAKFSHGLCDDTLSCVMRAWRHHLGTVLPACEETNVTDTNNPKDDNTLLLKPVLLAPAMNTDMWFHPLTQPQLSTISSFGTHVKIIAPMVKELACGQVGQGALAKVEDIVQAVQESFRG